MEPIFYAGQAVICVKCGSGYNHKDECIAPKPNILIEGKKYYIENPDSSREGDTVFVKVCGIKPECAQTLFVPEDFDRYADNELHQALKGIPETL